MCALDQVTIISKLSHITSDINATAKTLPKLLTFPFYRFVPI